MRLVLITLALAFAAACGDNQKAPAPEDAGTTDAQQQAGGPCLDEASSLMRPPTGALPCEMLPPGFTAP